MSTCCGGRRAALSGAHTPTVRGAPQQPRRAEALPAKQSLRYDGPVPMTLRAPASGTTYTLQQAGQQLAVDPRDVQALLHTGWFTPWP
jgi:hypothetical protein